MRKLLDKEIKFLSYSISGRAVVVHPLFSGSAIMIIGSNIANFFAYIYHVIFGRILGPSSYGELASIISMFGLVLVAFNFLGLVIVKFVSAADEESLPHIFSWFAKKAVLLGLLLGSAFFLAAGPISKFLHIDYKVIVLVSPIISVTIVALLFRTFLQGRLKFVHTSVLANSDMIGRLLLGLLFVYVGLSVFGVILGLLSAVVISMLLGKFFTRKYKMFGPVDGFNKGREVAILAVPIFFGTLSINSFYLIDVLLVKHFFDPHQAGLYAAVSTLGKIIFFGTAPIAGVMFPMVSRRHAKGQAFKKIFWFGLLMVIGIASVVLSIFYFIPKFAIKMLYGSRFIEVAPYLVWFGLFMMLFSLSSFLVNYYLSQNKKSVVIIPLIGAMVQAVGIWLYHDSLITVIQVSLFAAALLFGGLLIYFGYDTAKERK